MTVVHLQNIGLYIEFNQYKKLKYIPVNFRLDLTVNDMDRLDELVPADEVKAYV